MEQNSTPSSVLRRIHNLDVRAFSWLLERYLCDQMVRLARLVSRSADGFCYAIVGVAALALGGADGQTLFLALALAFAIERPLYQLLKKGFKRRRPANILPGFSAVIIPSDYFSFPSGHTSGAFLFATALIVVFPAAYPLAYLWAVAVGFSRIFLGVHFPTDTLMGALLGTGCALLSLSLLAV